MTYRFFFCIRQVCLARSRGQRRHGCKKHIPLSSSAKWGPENENSHALYFLLTCAPRSSCASRHARFKRNTHWTDLRSHAKNATCSNQTPFHQFRHALTCARDMRRTTHKGMPPASRIQKWDDESKERHSLTLDPVSSRLTCADMRQ